MIDIRLIRENPELVKENIRKRFKDDKVVLVDEIVRLDKDVKDLKSNVDWLRHRRNELSEEINKLKKEKKDIKHILEEVKNIPGQIKLIEQKLDEAQTKIDRNIMMIPNMLHSSVPMGKDESENVEIKKIGHYKFQDFELKNHAELIESLGYADFDAGRNNSGQGFNYLIGDMALLDNALQRYGVDFLMTREFTLVGPPIMLNFQTLLEALNGLKDFEDVVYKVENEDLYLIGTAEHALVSLNKNKTLRKDELPIKICAVTPCFRKEIGSRGVDTKGLFRMHQFNKVEQVVYCHPDESFKMLETMQSITEEFFQSLEIPFRVIEICSGDLGAKFAKQYDIEAWFPRQKKYAEVTSAGSCTDFQAHALNIRYLDGEEKKYVHILNNTMVATSRAMVAIIENYQNADGSITIPHVLQPYMHGKKKIEKK